MNVFTPHVTNRSLLLYDSQLLLFLSLSVLFGDFQSIFWCAKGTCKTLTQRFFLFYILSLEKPVTLLRQSGWSCKEVYVVCFCLFDFGLGVGWHRCYYFPICPWRRKFSRRSWRDSNSRHFNHESGAVTTEPSPLPMSLSYLNNVRTKR